MLSCHMLNIFENFVQITTSIFHFYAHLFAIYHLYFQKQLPLFFKPITSIYYLYLLPLNLEVLPLNLEVLPLNIEVITLNLEVLPLFLEVKPLK